MGTETAGPTGWPALDSRWLRLEGFALDSKQLSNAISLLTISLRFNSTPTFRLCTEKEFKCETRRELTFRGPARGYA